MTFSGLRTESKKPIVFKMVAKYPWAKPLHIPEQHLALWQSEISSHGSVLIWCIENRKVNETVYLAWAKKHYELPVLTSEFFEQPVSKEFFEQIKSVTAWTHTMIPLAQWDGVVFIACVEPPHEVQWSFPVQYVLAPLSGLKTYWDSLHGQKESTVSQVVMREDLPPTPASTRKPIAKSEKTPVPEVKIKAPVEEEFEGFEIAGDETPEGLDLGDEVTAPPQLKSDAKNAADNDSPEGLDFGTEFSNSEIGDGLEGLDATTPSMNQKLEDIADDLPAKIASDAMEDSSSGLSFAVPEFTSSSVMVQALSKDSSVKKETLRSVPAPAIDESTPVDDPTPIEDEAPVAKSSAGKAISLVAAPNAFSMSRNEDEAAAYVFAQMKPAFKSMVLLKKVSTGLVIWRWLEGQRVSSSAQHVDPDVPSLFRIVYKTRQPYHGSVVSNPVNDRFFKDLGMKQNPAHVTAQAVVRGADVIGILIGFGDATSNTPNNLALTKKLAEQIATRMNAGEKIAA